MEAKSFDIRMRISPNEIKPDPNIVIVEIDDYSLDYMEDEYGRWPWNRSAYTDMINFLESGNVNMIGFDLMFIGYQKGFEHIDKELVDTILKYDNIYLSMNFDNRENPNPPVMPESIKAKVENHSKIDFSDLYFVNCRTIIKELLDNSKNIGIINFKRDSDGISRRAPVFSNYRDELYPYLAVKMAKKYVQSKLNLPDEKYIIDANSNLVIGDKKLPLDSDGYMILNWYGPNNTFTRVPFYKIIKSVKAINQGKTPDIEPSFFKDKVVFVGVTATSLFDIKSIPLSSVYPGVEIQTTVFNNVIDGSAIKRVNKKIDIAISILLIIITSLTTLKIRSPFISSSITILLVILYIVLSSLCLKYFNLWAGMVLPITGMVMAFTIMYIIKYINKSRDFEYTYKLATTDGLTNLYNHRYFQEQMNICIENSKRYNTHFSLLLIDIDFFKKFNDTYGHQAGDAVLRQVAQLLKKNVRATDIVARYGGEEMAIILTNTNIDEAYFTANKICKAVAEKPFRLSETVEKHVTISIGVATYPQHATTSSELIEFADQGLYAAKEGGRNQVGKIKDYNPDQSSAISG